MNKYYIHIPGSFYALNFYADTKEKALQEYKKWAGVNRMPKGYSIWLSNNT